MTLNRVHNPAPPPPPKRRLKLADYLIFGIAAVFILYAIYRVNDVLVYHWDWSRVLGFVVRYDQTTDSWSPNIILRGLATTLHLAIWATLICHRDRCCYGLLPDQSKPESANYQQMLR